MSFRPSSEIDAVWLCRDPVDFRKGINGLSVLVEAQLDKDPFNGHLFVFINRRRDKVKILYWERSGFCLWQKQLEQEKFRWPTHMDGDVIVLDGQQLNWLLDGFDLAAMKPHRPLNYQTVL